MPRPSRLFCEIDLERDGKQTGFVRLPHSVHRSAYGWLPIPIACVRNGAGPRVLLMSGNHGDEYEGQVALMKLLRALAPGDVRGRIVFLTAANFPAAMAGMRTSPIDEGNLNRSFPGDPDGSVTQQIAYWIEHAMLPQCDYVLDIHSGGSSLMYVPSTLTRRHTDPAKLATAIDLMRTFGAPCGYLTDAPNGEDRTLTAAAIRQGVTHLSTELAGGGQVTPTALAIAEAGVRRYLHRIGALAGPAPAAAAPTRLLQVRGSSYYVYAPDAGIFEPLVELGAEVQAGDPAGLIHFTDTPWREPSLARFERGGFVLCKRVPGRSERGDCLFHLGAAFEP
ncbi:MAG: succinylglutamate desuccinylase/aspartoacylase family protein [Alphaproteobacteria bacterium]|nr:succinylglutamate desuccinylase/aspartoacylase family protein [Alphaproteobacteria bacterium]